LNCQSNASPARTEKILGEPREPAEIHIPLDSTRIDIVFMKNIAPAISPPSGIGENKPANQAVLDWVHEVELLTKPENVFWCDGSDREHECMLREAVRQNVLIKLNDQKVPRSYLHRSNPNDVARVEQFTSFAREQRRSWSNQQLERAGRDVFKAARPAQRRDGRSDPVRRAIYYGPPDSPLTKVGFEITDSIYVVLSMRDHDPDGRDRGPNGSAMIRPRNGTVASIHY